MWKQPEGQGTFPRPSIRSQTLVLRVAFLRRGSGKRRIAAELLICFLVSPEQPQRPRRHMLRGEAEVLHNLVARSRRSIMIDADHRSLVSRPSLPTHGGRRFHRDALLDGLR